MFEATPPLHFPKGSFINHSNFHFAYRDEKFEGGKLEIKNAQIYQRKRQVWLRDRPFVWLTDFAVLLIGIDATEV